jgi:hypothetical protein
MAVVWSVYAASMEPRRSASVNLNIKVSGHPLRSNQLRPCPSDSAASAMVRHPMVVAHDPVRTFEAVRVTAGFA